MRSHVKASMQDRSDKKTKKEDCSAHETPDAVSIAMCSRPLRSVQTEQGTEEAGHVCVILCYQLRGSLLENLLKPRHQRRAH